MLDSRIPVNYEPTTPINIQLRFKFGQSQNTQKPQCWPQGMDVIREWDDGTRWGVLNPAEDSYRWTVLDQRVAAAMATGVEILYVFGSTPAWAKAVPAVVHTGAYDATSNYPPVLSHLDKFSRALFTRYKGKIKYYEAWNEANALNFWAGSNAQLYAQQQVLFNNLKEIDPAAQLTMPTPCWSSSTVDVAIDTYLALGFQKYAHIVSFHGYGSPGAPATDIGPTLDRVNAVMAKYQCILPLWDTEYSMSGSANTGLIPVSQLRQWVIDSVMIRMKKGIRAAFWYQWDNQTHGTMCDLTGKLNEAGQAWVDLYNKLHWK
jgi:hypothetical protein